MDAQAIAADVERAEESERAIRANGQHGSHHVLTLAGHCRQLLAQNERLRALLRPFAKGHLYAEEELRPIPNLDAKALNPYDTDRSPTVGDCRRAAAALAEKPQ